MNARVKLLMVPTIQLSLGGVEDGFGFVAEEQYLITKSGFRGHLNVIHEDGPGDSVDLLDKRWGWLEDCLQGAFKEGAPNMTAHERVKLLDVFKEIVSTNADCRFELDTEDSCYDANERRHDPDEDDEDHRFEMEEDD